MQKNLVEGRDIAKVLCDSFYITKQPVTPVLDNTHYIIFFSGGGGGGDSRPPSV